MNRRAFIAGLGGAAAWPLATRAQQARIRRVGILMPYPPSYIEEQTLVRVFREEMRNRGWKVSENVEFDERWTTDDMDLIRSAAANIIELKPDAIVGGGARVIRLLTQMTHTIPVVWPGGTAGVVEQWVQSLARPAGNLTGFAIQDVSVIGKMLQILKEIAPSVSRVAIIYSPANPVAAFFDRAFASAAGPLHIEPVVVSQIRDLTDMERAVAGMAEQPNGGLLFPLDLTVRPLIDQTIATVARYRLPAVYSERQFVVKGGLVYYGADRIEIYRGAASYVDRLLHGEKPGDLPYQLPTKFQLVINLKTAKALGLELPVHLLAIADEVIE